MNQPPENDSPPASYQAAIGRGIKPWFSFAVVGLFVFACFYTLKLAKNLFLPIVLAGFLGFLLTPVTRWLKKIGLSNFWAPLLGTLAAVSWALVNPEPDRRPADLSSLVVPLGRGRHPARCSPPGHLQNILRSN